MGSVERFQALGFRVGFRLGLPLHRTYGLRACAGLLHVLLLMVLVVCEHRSAHVNLIGVSYAELSDRPACTPEPNSVAIHLNCMA